MNYISTIAKTVKIIREDRRVTQTELADKIGWSQSALSNFENGKRKTLDVNELAAIAKELEVNIADLIPDFTDFPPGTGKIADKFHALSPVEQKKMSVIMSQIITWYETEIKV